MVTKKDIESMGFNNISQYGFKQLFKADKNGYTFILSYRTVIGYMDKASQCIYLTNEYFSSTTSRHKSFIHNNYRTSLVWESIITLEKDSFDMMIHNYLNCL